MPYIFIVVDMQSLGLDLASEADIQRARVYCDRLYEALKNEYPSPNIDITVEPELSLFNGGRTDVSDDEEWDTIVSGGREGVIAAIEYLQERVYQQWGEKDATKM